MKKVLGIAIAIVMTLGLTGCQIGGLKITLGDDTPSQTAVDSETGSAKQSKPEDQDIQENQDSRENQDSQDGVYPPMEEAVEATRQLMDEFWSYAGKDYDAFSALFCNTDEEMIQSEFTVDENIDQYDSMNCIPLTSVDNHYFTNLIYYIVSGIHPNTHMDSYSIIMPVSYIDGEWKLDYSQGVNDILNEKLSDNPAFYPAGYLEAQKAGRNVALFDGYNWMYLDSSAVYTGCLQTELKFAWQDENGNLVLSLWMANGTNNNIYYTYLSDTLTDSALGEVINLSGVELGVPIKSMNSMLYEMTIPADQVLTGTQTWGELDNHINTQYK